MLKMFLLMYVLAGPTLAGIMMLIALVLRLDNTTMLTMTGIGALAALPVAWFVAKAIMERTGWGRA